MTISTTRIDATAHRGGAAFTLIEIMAALTLSLFVMAGVMSAFVMLGRTGMSIASYSVAEAEIRRGIEELSQDVRMARQIHWNSATSVTLTVPDNYTTTANEVTYAFDPSTSSFYRVPGDASSLGPRTVYVHEISSFAFSRYNRLNTPASTDAETKRLQVTMNVCRTRATMVAANTTLVSASYTLRNKAIN